MAVRRTWDGQGRLTSVTEYRRFGTVGRPYGCVTQAFMILLASFTFLWPIDLPIGWARWLVLAGWLLLVGGLFTWRAVVFRRRRIHAVMRMQEQRAAQRRDSQARHSDRR